MAYTPPHYPINNVSPVGGCDGDKATSVRHTGPPVHVWLLDLLPCSWRGPQTRYMVLAGHWWVTPVIPATQEAEIRRIVVQSQLG
jgi:hypothetical protein